MPRKKESILFLGVSEKVQKAARDISAKLDKQNIPHVLIGGLAVNAYAEPRATRDVDFFIPLSAQAVLGGIPLDSNVSRITIRHYGVNIDLLFPDEDEHFLEEAVLAPRLIDDMPVANPEVIVYLKMTAYRGARDQNDILNMIRSGLNLKKVEAYLIKNASDLVDDFYQLIKLSALEYE